MRRMSLERWLSIPLTGCNVQKPPYFVYAILGKDLAETAFVSGVEFLNWIPIQNCIGAFVDWFYK